jgi:hypothetical protein
METGAAMHYTIERLVQGDRSVCDHYLPESQDLVRLATMLSSEQTWFERNCGPRDHREIGREVMVASGFGLLYTTRAGFDDRAERARLLYDALQSSFCSIEVKVVARDVAASYGLLEERVA